MGKLHSKHACKRRENPEGDSFVVNGFISRRGVEEGERYGTSGTNLKDYKVESLTAARSASQAGTEPSDAIRVVNSVLTQLDQIKRHSNVVILTTSNVTQKIDLAFVDRADIKQYIGPPSASAIYSIYLSCLEELMKRQIIYPRQQLMSYEELGTIDFKESDVTHLSLSLRNISQRSVGLSGRVLRKIPFLAHALFGKTATMTIESFLEAMGHAVDKQRQEQASLVNCV